MSSLNEKDPGIATEIDETDGWIDPAFLSIVSSLTYKDDGEKIPQDVIDQEAQEAFGPDID